MVRHFHKRNLPHLYYNCGKYFITYRLADTIPISVLKEFEEEIKNKFCYEDLTIKEKRIFQKYDKYLDNASHKNDYLIKDEFADIVKDTLHFPDGRDYFLICYCIMPNHVHLVFELLEANKGMDKIMQSIKRISARHCNKLLNKEGPFWQDESYDRFIRDEVELYNTINYVLNNPVHAGFVSDWRDWKYTYLAEKYGHLSATENFPAVK